MIAFRVFGREFVIERWCGWTEVSPWETVWECHHDKYDTRLLWVGPIHFITCSLEEKPVQCS